MLIGGLVLILAAIIFALAYVSRRRRLNLIRSTETSSIELLRAQAASHAEEDGEGSFSRLAEVKGRVHCDTPLVSELAEIECVYYSMRLQWEYEETQFEESSDGKQIRHTLEGNELLASNTEMAPFVVVDAFGSIKVDPEGAEIIAENALSRVETDEGLPDEYITIGRFRMEAPWKTSFEERRPLRYFYEEKVIPVGHDVYVLGEATDRDGELCIQRPARKGRFIVSVKPEEELVRSGRMVSFLLLLVAYIFGGIGVAIVLYELMHP